MMIRFTTKYSRT